VPFDDAATLTIGQHLEFAENGFLVLRNVIPPEVGSSRALLTFICVLCTLCAQISWIHMQLYTLQLVAAARRRINAELIQPGSVIADGRKVVACASAATSPEVVALLHSSPLFSR
jgi:hypothetical protein